MPDTMPSNKLDGLDPTKREKMSAFRAFVNTKMRSLIGQALQLTTILRITLINTNGCYELCLGVVNDTYKTHDVSNSFLRV